MNTIPFIQAACFSRGRAASIRYLVCHAEQGYFAGTISWFKNPASQVSAHYVLGQKGEITQMVQESDRAWATVNANSMCVSIEHEDQGKCMTDPNWFTPEMWAVSTQLAAQICMRHNIPVENIIGHNDPILQKLGNTHPCPGPFWAKNTYRHDVQQLIAKTPKHMKAMHRAKGWLWNIISMIGWLMEEHPEGA